MSAYPLTPGLRSVTERLGDLRADGTALPRLTDSAVELVAQTGVSGWCLAHGRLEDAADDVLTARERWGHGGQLDEALRRLADVLLDRETPTERAARVAAALERRRCCRRGS